jgi:hypothetical protein
VIVLRPRGLWVLLLAAAAASAAAEDAPAWLKAAASAPLSAYDKKVAAVVLLDEGEATVDEDGRVRRTLRHAIKVLTREGRDAAVARIPYGPDAGKVRSLDAWRIRSSGGIRSYGKDATLDAALAPNDVYDEARVRVISARDDVDPGDVFGYESVVEERALFAQDIWSFQERWPVRASRYSLTLPQGWRAEGVVLNHAPVAPLVSGSRYTWELKELPFEDEEAASPPVTQIAPRLAVSYFPAAAGGERGLLAFADWRGVSRWYSGLADPQAAPAPSLAAKARELTVDTRTEIDRIRAVARFVQATNYISVQIALGRYRPHAAVDVLARSYGDCKDKAALMKALLAALGIEAHLVLIHAGDPAFVREEWPSPLQFNHCILAIRLREPAPLGAVLDEGGLGRLLVFDPTDEQTPVGDLPTHEQGSLALVAASDAGRLLRMPLLPPEANGIVRRIEASLEAQGSLRAVVQERLKGQAAAAERRAFASLAPAAAKERIERWVTANATGASLSRLEPTDDPIADRFTLDVAFEAPRYAQIVQGRLLVLRPVILSRRGGVWPSEATRRRPVCLEAEAFSESLSLSLPADFAIDELPEAASITAPFGSYTTSIEAKGGVVTFERRLVLQRASVPADQYASVRGFYEKVRAAEQAPIVLARRDAAGSGAGASTSAPPRP